MLKTVTKITKYISVEGLCCYTSEPHSFSAAKTTGIGVASHSYSRIAGAPAVGRVKLRPDASWCFPRGLEIEMLRDHENTRCRPS
jgi:hypothetical protein